MDKKKDFMLKNKNLIAALGTMLFAAALIFLLFFIVFQTTIPPFPDDTGGGGGSLGIEVNLGIAEDGMGIIQSDEISTPEFSSKALIAENSEQEQEKLLTEENSDDISSMINDTKNKTEKKKNAEVANKEEKKTDENVNKQPVVNSTALYKKNKNTNQGETNKAGDQGNPNGTIYSKNYKGNGGGGDGSGVGKGSGNGNGDGKGNGSGKGKGTSFKLDGRTKKFLPEPKYDIQESGIVTVDIVVNREGKVIRARAGGRGTTTTNSTLWKSAEEAAYKTMFSSKSDAAEEQKGSITYHFILN